jgi:hypothetical protein
MTDEDRYQQDLLDARERLDFLLKWRDGLETLIARTKRKIALLTELTAESAQAPDLDIGGLQDACITVLRSSKKDWLTAAEVQSELRDLGFPMDEYKAPQASVVTTINRLVGSGKVKADREQVPGTTLYRWAESTPTWVEDFGRLIAEGLTGKIGEAPYGTLAGLSKELERQEVVGGSLAHLFRAGQKDKGN